MTTVVVVIGRNVGDELMSTRDWASFCHATKRAVVDRFMLVTEAEGRGVYEGTIEDSAVYVGVSNEFDRPEFEDELGDLAYEYGQESIAVVYGDTIFVKG